MTEQTGPTGRGALDVHAHAVPRTLLDRLAADGLADLTGLDEGVVRFDPRVSGVGPGAPIPIARAQWDPSGRPAEMARSGVERQLVSLPPFVTCAGADDEDLVRSVARCGNDGLVAVLAPWAGTMDPLGFVPLGTPWAVSEARRCIEELGCAGIAIGTRGLGRELDDPVHEPLWSYLADAGVFAFVHPNGVPDGARLHDFWLPQLVGFPMETAIAAARLVFGGVLERHDVALVLAHGGGCLPILRGRMDMGWQRKDVARTTPQPPGAYLDRLYYDSATFSPQALRRLVDDVGAGRVMVGTDYPFELAEHDPVGAVGAAGLSARQRAQVLHGTLSALLAARAGS
ncbi:amidohydrolase family protein [Pseudonocardia kongjuensis]|uniref:Amidohydrolase family protein n=1 Tax=Pseudonocardia kongjuensis TaxID=102227 RepID=A0ABN1XS53_9PSEU